MATTYTSERPIALGPNLPETFYRGAGRIARFRGVEAPARPEDWVASTTTRFGDTRAGLTELAPGLLLLDAIAADPAGWLGAAVDGPGVLVKLLDAGQRLPVHVHPDGRFARAHLHRPCGKTEAWIIVEAEPGATVRLGFSRDVSADELRVWVEGQQVAALLAATNEIPVRPGDAILCPAGQPHAIGAGILLVELQEPSDLSVLLEWSGFAPSADGAFLGLSAEEALACVDRAACGPEQLQALMSPAPGSLLPAAAAPFFRAEPLGPGTLAAGFSIIVATGGLGELSGTWGALSIGPGATVVVPAGAGDCTVTGDLVGVVCRPPL